MTNELDAIGERVGAKHARDDLVNLTFDELLPLTYDKNMKGRKCKIKH